MLHLLFAPKDDPAAGAVVAEPSAEAPPAAEPAPETPPETPGVELPEAVPASEQEHPAPKSAEDSGAPKAEDEVSVADARQSQLDDIDALAEADPEFAAELAKRRAAPEENVGEEKLAWEREKGQEERQAAWTAASANYQRYTPETAEASLTALLTQLNDNIVKAAKDFGDGVEGATAAGIQFDPAAVAKLHTPTIQHTARAAFNVVSAAVNSSIVSALSGHAAYGYLTAEERTQFSAAVNSGKYDEAITLQLDAAIRAAPEEAKKTAKVTAEKDAGLMKKYEDLKVRLGKNGLPSTGQPTASSQPKDETEAHAWHASGKWTTQQMRNYLAKRR